MRTLRAALAVLALAAVSLAVPAAAHAAPSSSVSKVTLHNGLGWGG
ncbi:hypothetical protein [Phycicoccus duodecadis]|uniref:Uncharacterized protein n=1 Tax=Phycicoccus duodecadis TaxID=173053 RepID=A0A2N3YGV6_9MICO|nr:hypothetical protein [Phycicoccus duodecadis]PKW26079.1 hypothetical protein ATL31_0884 [Phycicoccus duodecadis]